MSDSRKSKSVTRARDARYCDQVLFKRTRIFIFQAFDQVTERNYATLRGNSH